MRTENQNLVRRHLVRARRVQLVEQLESRQLLAADLGLQQIFPLHYEVVAGDNNPAPVVRSADSAPIVSPSQVVEFDPATRTEIVRSLGEADIKLVDTLNQAAQTQGFAGIGELLKSLGEPPRSAIEAQEDGKLDAEGKGSGSDSPERDYIFGPDGRTRVTETTVYPYSAVGKQWQSFGSSLYTCSGAMIDPYHWLTAGHCVHEGSGGAWADDITVSLAQDGMPLGGTRSTDQYYGEADWQYVRSFTGWTNSGDFNWDFSVVTLDRNIGNFSGWLGYGWNSDNNFFNNANYMTSGYPGDLNNSTLGYGQYQQTGNPRTYGITTDLLRTNTMDVWPGQSGSSVWSGGTTSPVSYGVASHQTTISGVPAYNAFARITQAKFDAMQSWRTEDNGIRVPTDRPDLVDYDDWFNTSSGSISTTALTPGQEFTATVYPRNNGTAASGSFSVRFRLSSDSTYDSGDYYLGDTTVNSIGAFGWGTAFGSLVVPSSIPAGNYYLVYNIDVFGDSIEYVESNNTASLPNQLSVSADPNDQIIEATNLTLGGSTAGFVDPGFDVDMYAITVDAGRIVGFDIDRTSTTLDSYLRLFDSAGNEITVSDDNPGPSPEPSSLDSYIEHTFAVAGTYYIAVSAFLNSNYSAITGEGDKAGSTGSYQLIAHDMGKTLYGTATNDLFNATYTGDGIIHQWSVTRNGTAVFTGNITDIGSLVIDGMGGSDTLQMFGMAVDDTIVLDGNRAFMNGGLAQFLGIESLKIYGGNGNDDLMVFGGVGLFDGGSGVDTVQAIFGINLWNITGSGIGSLNSDFNFTKVESLKGGNGPDQFDFGASGRLTGRVYGGADDDVLNFAAKTTTHTVSLQTKTATSTGGFDEIESFIGSGAGTDVFVGANAPNTWVISGANMGFLNIQNNFSGFENLTGGTGIDNFAFDPAGSLSGKILGGTGADILNLAAKTTAFDVRLGSVPNIPGVLGGFSSVEQVVGNDLTGTRIVGTNGTTAWSVNTAGNIFVSSVAYSDIGAIAAGTGADTLAGPALANIWSVTGSNSGTLNTAGSTYAFTGIENLNGGSAADDMSVGATGNLTGKANGGSGPDTLNLSAKTSSLNFQLGTIMSVPGVLGGYSAFEQVTGNSVAGTKITGSNVATSWTINASGQIVVSSVTYGGVGMIASGSGADTLIGPALANNWTINGSNAGSLNTGIQSFTFTGVENLTGGLASDIFDLIPGGSLAGNLNGGGGTAINSLSYSQWINNVSVNLAVSTASNATAIGGVTSLIQMVTGGAGNDSLTGQAAKSTVLIGLAGNDTLVGGSQRDLLLGGMGADVLQSVAGEDLLVSGTTAFDLNQSAILLIHAEWTSSRTFAQRTANIWGNGTGARSNADTFLNNGADAIVDTVFADVDTDSLTGGIGPDWFFGLAAEVTDFVSAGSSPDRRD